MKSLQRSYGSNFHARTVSEHECVYTDVVFENIQIKAKLHENVIQNREPLCTLNTKHTVSRYQFVI